MYLVGASLMTDADEDTTWSVERPLVTEISTHVAPHHRGAEGGIWPPHLAT